MYGHRSILNDKNGFRFHVHPQTCHIPVSLTLQQYDTLNIYLCEGCTYLSDHIERRGNTFVTATTPFNPFRLYIIIFRSSLSRNMNSATYFIWIFLISVQLSFVHSQNSCSGTPLNRNLVLQRSNEFEAETRKRNASILLRFYSLNAVVISEEFEGSPFHSQEAIQSFWEMLFSGLRARDFVFTPDQVLRRGCSRVYVETGRLEVIDGTNSENPGRSGNYRNVWDLDSSDIVLRRQNISWYSGIRHHPHPHHPR